MTIIKCNECQREISSLAPSCPGCGALPIIQKQTVPHPAPTSGHRALRRLQLVAVVLSLVLVAVIFAKISQTTASKTVEKETIEKNQPEVADRTEQTEKLRIASLSKEERENEEQKKQDALFDSLSTKAELLIRNRGLWDTYYANKNNDKKKPNVESVSTVELNNIVAQIKATKFDDLHASKMKPILDQLVITAREAFLKLQGTKRSLYAYDLEKRLLKQGMNTNIKTSGENDTTLIVIWELANRITFQSFSDSGIMKEAETMGFSKVVFKKYSYDNSDYNQWITELHPVVE